MCWVFHACVLGSGSHLLEELEADAGKYGVPGLDLAKPGLIGGSPRLCERRERLEVPEVLFQAQGGVPAGGPRLQDEGPVARLGEEEFATSANTTQPLSVGGPNDDVTDDDIERAIAEIQSAIKKVPR